MALVTVFIQGQAGSQDESGVRNSEFVSHIGTARRSLAPGAREIVHGLFDLKIYERVATAEPSLVATFHFDAEISGIERYGDTVYLCASRDALYVVDLAPGSAPSITRKFLLGCRGSDFRIVPPFMFADTWSHKWTQTYVFDVSQPQAPVGLFSYSTWNKRETSFALLGESAWFIDYKGALVREELSRFVGRAARDAANGSLDFESEDRAEEPEVIIEGTGDEAYQDIARRSLFQISEAGLHFAPNASKPDQKRLLLDAVGVADRPTIIANLAAGGGAEVYPRPGATPVPAVTWKPAESWDMREIPDWIPEATGARARGEWAWVAGGRQLCAIDISVPAKPRVASRTMLSGDVSSMDLDGDRVAVAIGTGVEFFDVSNSSLPRRLTAIDSMEKVRKVRLAQGRAYVMGERRIDLLDCADPSNPKPRGEYVARGELLDFDIGKGHMYVIDSGLRVVNVSEPATPSTDWEWIDSPPKDLTIEDQFFSEYGEFTPRKIAVSDDQVLFSWPIVGPAVILSLRLADSGIPKSLAHRDIHGNVFQSSGYAWGAWTGFSTGGEYYGLGWERPQMATAVAGEYDSVIDVRDIAVIGNLALIADGGNGLTIIRMGGVKDDARN